MKRGVDDPRTNDGHSIYGVRPGPTVLCALAHERFDLIYPATIEPGLSGAKRNCGVVSARVTLFKTAKNFDEKESSYVNESMMPTNIFHFVHNDTPKGNGTSDVRPSSIKRALPQECRRSIDKIYNLMNEMVNSNKAEIEDGRTNRTGDNETQPAEKRSDRNKSVSKSSDVDELMTSNFCINKVNRGNNKRNEISVSTVPQPDANFKSSRARLDVHEKNKFSFKEVKSNNLDNVNHDTAFRAVSRARRTSDGGARGQNMKRTHVAADRRASDYITYNKLTDSRRYHRSDYTRPSRAERRERERELWCNRNESISPRKKCVKLSQIENTKVAIGGDNTFDNYVKRNIADVIDEAKEARGEAVRGPPKLNATRLDALAQPRRPYVQAHSEYYRRRHGRTLVADRLQRLAAPAHPSVPNASPSRNYTHVDTPAKIPKKLNKGKSTIVRARTRSSSPEAQSPTPSPSTRNKYAERPLRWKPTQLTSRQPEVCRGAAAIMYAFYAKDPEFEPGLVFYSASTYAAGQHTGVLTARDLPREGSLGGPLGTGSHWNTNTGRVVERRGLRRAIYRHTAHPAPALQQKFITEEPSAVDESLNDNSDSNNDLLKACEDSAEKLFTMCHEYKEENEIENATYVITTQYTANNNLSAEFSEISNLTNTDNSNTNVTTDLSIDQRKLEDKFDTRLNLIRKFNKQIQNNSDEVDLVNVGVQDRILYNAFQETVKFNEESENCPNRSNQILIVKSGNPVRSIDPEAELELLLVLDVLPRILKTHLDFKLPDLPIQIATVNYAISQYNNVECITSNYDKYHKRIDLTRQITDERLTESRSAEVIGNIQNHQHKKSVLTYQCSSSNCNDDENDSVLDAEIKLCEAYTICSNSRETNESKRSPFNKDYDVRCKEKIPTKIFSKNDFKFSDRFDNKFNTSKVDEADEDMQKNLNSSSSLDILVGLLNEIKNISKCQAYIATNYDYGAKIMDDPHEDSHSLKTWNSNSTRSDFKNGSRTVSGVSTPDQKCSKSTENELTHQSYLSSIQKSKTQNNYPGDGLGFDSKCVSCDIIGQMEYIEKGINVQMGENGLVNVYVDTPPEGPAGEGEGEGGGARSSRLGARSRSSGGNALALKDLNKRTVHYHRSLIDINVASQPYTDTVIIYKKMGNAVNNATNIAENMKLSKEHQIIHIGKNDFEKTANPHTFGVDDCQGPDPLLKLKRDILVIYRPPRFPQRKIPATSSGPRPLPGFSPRSGRSSHAEMSSSWSPLDNFFHNGSPGSLPAVYVLEKRKTGRATVRQLHILWSVLRNGSTLLLALKSAIRRRKYHLIILMADVLPPRMVVHKVVKRSAIAMTTIQDAGFEIHEYLSYSPGLAPVVISIYFQDGLNLNQLNRSGRSFVDPPHSAAGAGVGMSLWLGSGHHLRRDTAFLGHDMETIVSRRVSVSSHLVFVGRIG
ncbi:hypothetical protein EVAR_86319_1 [Eumeta japonica]|uniref:Uncharacterized protein n=1 Tax=Eumeta variegata TaxID=151549 RepID=A0A4C1X7A8_EUMVA|nr:hypothetical protein EVAR_86319_1 [Eumeta japonica]